MLRITRGKPSDEELVALIVILAALRNAATEPPAQRSAWADPAHRLRAALHPGPGAWRNSAAPAR